VSPSRPKTPAANLLLSIGGLAGRLELGVAPEPFLAQVRARYGAFALPAAPTVDAGFSLRLRFETAPPPADMAAHVAKTEAHPLIVKATDKTITLTRWDFSVRLTARRSRGRIEWVGSGRCRMSPFSLDCILRVLWSVLLPREDALLVHSCGLRHAEIGVVFRLMRGLF
jgi:hypothetical protein